MRASDLQDDPRRLNSVTVDTELCMGCMKCIRTCCNDVYEWDSVERLPIVAYSEECVSCYQCMFFCPAGAITVKEAKLAFYDQLYDPLGMNDLEVK